MREDSAHVTLRAVTVVAVLWSRASVSKTNRTNRLIGERSVCSPQQEELKQWFLIGLFTKLDHFVHLIAYKTGSKNRCQRITLYKTGSILTKLDHSVTAVQNWIIHGH